MQYKSYTQSPLGIIEVSCSDKYLERIILVKDIDSNVSSNNLSKEVVKQLQEYFNSKRTSFNIPILDNGDFKSKVYKALYKVPYGEVVTYKSLGDSLNTKAYRAVGSAMATNPYFIVVPCHRVLRSNGDIGEFFYGSAMKKQMIFKERDNVMDKKVFSEVSFENSEIENLSKHPVLNKMFDRMEMITSFKQFKDPYESVISSIIYQQVAFKVAKRSEVNLYYECNYKLSPTKMIQFKDAQFKSIGITGARVKYIRNFSEFVLNNPSFWNNIDQIEEKEIIQTLLSIKGIGAWTIEMFLLFGLGKKDVVSFGDLIIRNALEVLYNFKITTENFYSIKEELKGFESIASMNMWKYIEDGYAKIGKS